MVLTDSAQLIGAIQLFSLVVSARNMAPMGSALTTTAIQPPGIKKEIATGIAVTAAKQCAKQKAAPRSLKHVVSASSMERMESARLMVAQPMQHEGSSIATDTAVERRNHSAPS